ncbi:MAG: hypothetical protein JWM02_1720 [Frankiales bacterium]|nr:hypothetical protein [Frankiales bacterium]
MTDDDVQLTDLEVIQQFSLAVRGATASRREVIAALEADLAYLNDDGRRRATAPGSAPAASKPAAPPAKRAVKKAPVKTTRARRA